MRECASQGFLLAGAPVDTYVMHIFKEAIWVGFKANGHLKLYSE